MNLGELRKLTAHLPDDADVVCRSEDATYWEAASVRMLPPVLGHPWCIIVDDGQELTEGLDLHHRDGL